MIYVYVYIYEPWTVFGTSRNRQGVPTSFSSLIAFLRVSPRFGRPHLLLIAKLLTCDAYPVLSGCSYLALQPKYDVFGKPR